MDQSPKAWPRPDMQEDPMNFPGSGAAYRGGHSTTTLHQEQPPHYSTTPTDSSSYGQSSISSGSSPIFKDDETSDQLIIAHLENIVRDMIHSVNIRNFEPQAHPWSTHMAANARVVPGNLLQAVEMDRQGYLKWLNSITAARPHFTQTITELMTTVKNENAAEVIASKDTHGSPPGLVKPSIVMMEFKLFDRHTWMCTSIRSVHGIESMPGG